MTEILAQLKAQWTECRRWRFTPTRYEHVNPHGRYKFNLEEELARTALRDLRPLT